MNEDEYIDFFFKEIEILMDAISESDHVAMLNHTSLILSMTPDDTKKRLPQVKKLIENNTFLSEMGSVSRSITQLG